MSIEEWRNLNHEEMTILLELHKFARQRNAVGERYQVVGVPARLFRKAMIALRITPMSQLNPNQKVINEGRIPERIIEEKTQEFFNAYLKANPDDTDEMNLRYVRMRCENAAIIQYLNQLFKNGKLGGPL